MRLKRVRERKGNGRAKEIRGEETREILENICERGGLEVIMA